MFRLRLEERLREVAVHPEVVWEYRRWEDARVIFRQKFGDEDESVFGVPFYVVHRADLLGTLSEAVPDDIVHLGHSCTTLTQNGGVVELGFEDGSSASADVVVGADGIRSTVRNIVVPPKPAHFSVFVATVASSQ